MKLIPKETWRTSGAQPLKGDQPISAWRDLDFLAVLYPVADNPGHQRLSVNRVAYELDTRGRPIWRDGITWDDLMRVKRECGFGDRWAVEVFPPDSDAINVANMRHLWLLPGRPCSYGWVRVTERTPTPWAPRTGDRSDTPGTDQSLHETPPPPRPADHTADSAAPASPPAPPAEAPESAHAGLLH